MIKTVVMVALVAATQTLTVEHLAVPAPEGYVVEKQAGPDFAVYHVHPKGEAVPDLGMYLGNHASAFAPEKGTRRERLRIGRLRAEWTLWESTEEGVRSYHAEAVLERPFGTEPGYSTHLHLFAVAHSRDGLRALQAVAAAIRPIAPPSR